MVMLEGTPNDQLLYCHKYVCDNICISTTKRSPTNQPTNQTTNQHRLLVYIDIFATNNNEGQSQGT
jgi:hypothetical protein